MVCKTKAILEIAMASPEDNYEEEERAAILQFDAGMHRQEAEFHARRMYQEKMFAIEREKLRRNEKD